MGLHIFYNELPFLFGQDGIGETGFIKSSCILQLSDLQSWSMVKYLASFHRFERIIFSSICVSHNFSEHHSSCNSGRDRFNVQRWGKRAALGAEIPFVLH